jgi:glutamate-1-semialdehyde 2,1-aminomutase
VGPRLQDADGHWYIDYAAAWGPVILGYSHPALVAAAHRAAERPFTYGAQHELEISVAERIQAAVPSAERVAFSSSGSEVVQLVHRLARAFTRRTLILKFEGHYHGWIDGALVSYHPREGLGPRETPNVIPGSFGQVPNVVENVLVAPWNDLAILEGLFRTHPDRIAAVMMEPVLCNSGCLMPAAGYLEGVRDLCRRHGTLFIMDEVITGFRIALGGAQAHFGVTPDLSTFGKAVAGGAPLSVVAGRREIMEQLHGAGVAFGGTFNGNPLSLGIADATLEELARDGGAALVQANRAGQALMEGIRALGQRHGLRSSSPDSARRSRSTSPGGPSSGTTATRSTTTRSSWTDSSAAPWTRDSTSSPTAGSTSRPSTQRPRSRRRSPSWTGCSPRSGYPPAEPTESPPAAPEETSDDPAPSRGARARGDRAWPVSDHLHGPAPGVGSDHAGNGHDRPGSAEPASHAPGRGVDDPSGGAPPRPDRDRGRRGRRPRPRSSPLPTPSIPCGTSGQRQRSCASPTRA